MSRDPKLVDSDLGNAGKVQPPQLLLVDVIVDVDGVFARVSPELFDHLSRHPVS